LMVAVVDGGSNDGVFTTPSQDNNNHPCPHLPCPCPPSDKDWMAGWRAHHDASHLLLLRLSLLAPSCLHLRDNGTKDNGCGNRQGCHADICGREEVGHHDPIGMGNKNKNKNKTKQKQNQQQWRQCHRLCACRQLCPCCHCCCLCGSRVSSGGSTGIVVAAAAAERLLNIYTGVILRYLQ
jgi:hypothetical protein